MPLETPTFHLDGIVKSPNEDRADFDGPLDLILHLLSKNKVEIKDIQIASLSEQYLAWIARRKELNLEIASEFVAMAAHLVYIKSRMLLSIHDEEAMSEMELLIASLEERQHRDNYAKIKSVTDHLDRSYQIGRNYITKLPEQLPAQQNVTYQHSRQDLRRALSAVLERLNNKLPLSMTVFEEIVGRDPFPVPEKARTILERLLHVGVARFRALLRISRSRSEVVATFLAVLELCKANRVRLAGTAEECTVTYTGEGMEENLEITTDTY